MNFSSVKFHNFPFTHFTFSNFFSENELVELKNLELFDDFGNVLTKTRTSSKVRKFVNEDTSKKYPILNGLKDFFSNKDTVDLVRSLNPDREKEFPNHLRIEIIKDVGQSWLEPHCDISEKYLSLLIFINDCGELEEIGTDLYDAELKKVKTVPYVDNTGYFFYPANNTWHGLELKTIKTHRKIVMVNYVSFETEIRLK